MKLIDITGVVHHETERAILFSDDGQGPSAKWLPKSQVEQAPNALNAGLVDVTMPEWLAKDKGFV
jgi:hypothetical protein